MIVLVQHSLRRRPGICIWGGIRGWGVLRQFVSKVLGRMEVVSADESWAGGATSC